MNEAYNYNGLFDFIIQAGSIAIIIAIVVAIIWFYSLLNTIWTENNTKEIERRMKIIYDQETEKNRKLDRIIQLLENMQKESGEPGNQQNNSGSAQWAFAEPEEPKEKKNETRLSQIAKFLTKEL